MHAPRTRIPILETTPKTFYNPSKEADEQDSIEARIIAHLLENDPEAAQRIIATSCEIFEGDTSKETIEAAILEFIEEIQVYATGCGFFYLMDHLKDRKAFEAIRWLCKKKGHFALLKFCIEHQGGGTNEFAALMLDWAKFLEESNLTDLQEASTL